MHYKFFAHSFHNMQEAPFSIYDYSRLKFGSDHAAKKMGKELAGSFFKEYEEKLVANRCVVIPSPYNFVKNAATILTEHFCNTLNDLLMKANGSYVDYSMIHRKVSYTNDYGFLSQEKRKALIDNDSFYINQDFLKGKTLILIDDVRITGTHENKLVELIDKYELDNEVFFLYYASYEGKSPHVEAELNFAGIDGVEDYIQLMQEDNHHTIVRPIKYILNQKIGQVEYIISLMDDQKLQALYHGCLGEGYFNLEHYRKNCERIRIEIEKRRL